MLTVLTETMKQCAIRYVVGFDKSDSKSRLLKYLATNEHTNKMFYVLMHLPKKGKQQNRSENKYLHEDVLKIKLSCSTH